jgi:DNA-binding transcriptional ArsR family regulator
MTEQDEFEGFDLITANENAVRHNGDQATPAAAGSDTRYVLRLSRVASGARTWTVGASMGEAADEGQVAARLLSIDAAIEARVRGQIPRQHPAGTDGGEVNLTSQLARTLILTSLTSAGEWVPTSDLLESTKLARTTLVYHLNRLVSAGLVEKRQGKGASDVSTYRLVPKAAELKAVK